MEQAPRFRVQRVSCGLVCDNPAAFVLQMLPERPVRTCSSELGLRQPYCPEDGERHQDGRTPARQGDGLAEHLVEGTRNHSQPDGGRAFRPRARRALTHTRVAAKVLRTASLRAVSYVRVMRSTRATAPGGGRRGTAHGATAGAVSLRSAGAAVTADARVCTPTRVGSRNCGRVC